MNRPLHAEHSPDESVRDNAGPVQIVRFGLPKETRELITSILLALSILVNIALWLAYRYDAQERDLDRYDDGQRQEKVDKELADLSSKISVNEKLIDAYGLQKSLQEQDNGRTHHHP
jgi:hypothetical protein